VAKQKKARTTTGRKKMSRKMTFVEMKAVGDSFSRRPPATFSGNDEEEKEEEEEDEGEKKDEGEEQDEEEEEEEEEEEDEGRKGWSD